MLKEDKLPFIKVHTRTASEWNGARGYWGAEMSYVELHKVQQSKPYPVKSSYIKITLIALMVDAFDVEGAVNILGGKSKKGKLNFMGERRVTNCCWLLRIGKYIALLSIKRGIVSAKLLLILDGRTLISESAFSTTTAFQRPRRSAEFFDYGLLGCDSCPATCNGDKSVSDTIV